MMMNILNTTALPPRKPNIYKTNLIYQSEVIQCLLKQEQRFGESHLGGKKRIALFDLDNTLIVGDVGDAVFAQLLVDGFPLSLTWKEYKSLSGKNPHNAYLQVVRAMEGLTVENIIKVSKRVLQSDDEFIMCEGECVPLPKPNMLMQEIVRLLREWDYSIFIVSASNDISVKIAGSLFFNVPSNNMAGIKSEVLDNKLTRKILEPIPIGVGKVAQYRIMSGDRIPMIVATDNELDIPMLHICDPDGIVIIVGENQKLYKIAKSELPQTLHFYRVPSFSASSMCNSLKK